MTRALRRAAGDAMVVGLSGKELTGLERAWLKLIRPAGVILFQRNIESAEQTRALLRDTAALCAPHGLRCVDVEGGTVDRLREALAPMPPARAVWLAAESARTLGLIRRHGELVARAVKAFGFNTTLAPVLDLALPASEAVMGARTVSADPKAVAAYCRQFLAGLAAHKVAGCGKHFPGLGGGTLDSHKETPAIDRTPREMTNCDLYPYLELLDRLSMIMVSHAAYPKTPGGARPASVSHYWIDHILRKRMRFRGIIFSDDLEMGGVLNFLPIEGAAVEAIRAGIDLIEICHSSEPILRAYEAVLAEAERSSVFRMLLLDRSRRSAHARAKLFARPMPPALSAKRFVALKSHIESFAAKIAALQPAPEDTAR